MKEIPAELCPKCGEILDTSLGFVPGYVPIPGDFTICSICGNVQIFNDDLTRRDLTPDELAEVQKVPIVNAAIKAVERSYPERYQKRSMN